jgi:ribonuclease P protein component
LAKKLHHVGVHSFSRDKRLLSAADYKQVFDGVERRASHKHLLLLARQNNRTQSRLGLVIAKKHVKLAVERNRIKRVSREFFRSCPAPEENLDVVLLVRHGVDQLDNASLSSILRQQWQKLTAP